MSCAGPRPKVSRVELDRLYAHYNRREMVDPDPLQFLYDYPDVADREIVGLVASALALGNVKQILHGVRAALILMGSPARFVHDTSPAGIRRAFSGFRHRMITGDHLATLLAGARRVILRHGSLRGCFLKGLSKADADVMPAVVRFAGELNQGARGRCGHLLPDPARGSACKRLHLFLRWMVRRDAVDPGGWEGVGAHRLLVPVDTHMLRLGRSLDLTRRRQADLRTAREITDAFRRFSPEDPVKYDFALTRIGIRKDGTLDQFFSAVPPPEAER